MNQNNQRIFIFLDVDGVLNTVSQWKRPYSLNDACIAAFDEYVHSLPTNDFKIILTSSWKSGFDFSGNHTPQIRELVDKLAAYGLSIISKTENIGDDRAEEINDYIRKHHLEQYQCIVVDDDPGIFRSKLLDNCKMLWIDAKTGFTANKKPYGPQRILRAIIEKI